LERIDHPHIVAYLHGVDRAKGIAPVLQRDLKDAAIDAFERLGDVGLAAFRGDRQRAQQGLLRFRRKRLEFPASGLEQEIGRDNRM